MNLRTLPYKNISYYSRYYKLIAVAVLITITVIAGSLVVGDSVRTTLVNRVNERLGNTETIIFSRNSFIADSLLGTPLFKDTARGILLVNGFISQNGKLIPVFVWGVEDMDIPRGKARINPTLASEITPDEEHTAIVLRLPATGLIPSGSLFVTENYTTSMRLSYDGTVDAAGGGNINMKNEQILPSNIFVNRRELAEALAVEGKINLILSESRITGTDFSAIWTYNSSGLSVHRKDSLTEIRSDRVFIQKEVIDCIIENNSKPNRLFSYLANSMETGGESIPYSFVTAIDQYKGKALRPDEMILPDYSAKRLKAKIGDVVTVSYFTSKDLKTLVSKSISLKVKEIIPLAELQVDTSLSADFPGLSDVERCTDWDSDLPINMDLITDEDERYWELYRTTPKAIIPYEAVAGDWGNAYGNATAIRLPHASPDLEGLTPSMFGIQVIQPREAGIYAARHGVDFSGLFLALGFFIILSAMLLMLIPLTEMLFMRKEEINTLKALGFPEKRIVKMLWKESAPVVLISSIAGVVAGLIYTSLIMWLLGNVWKGATHTDGFSVYPGMLSLIIGLIAGAGLSLCLLRLSIGRSIKEKRVGGIHRQIRSVPSRRILAVLSALLSLLFLAIIGISLFMLQSVALFVIAGVLLIVTAFLWGDYIVCSKGSGITSGFGSGKLIWNTLYANKKQAALSFFALTTGVFIVFSVGLNRKGFADSAQIRTGTGGYTLWVESTVPVYHNMMTDEGRSKLSLTTLPDSTTVSQCLRYHADDASCLNLNKVSNPTVLGVDMTTLLNSDFEITQNIYSTNRTDFFNQMQQPPDKAYPALVDATVLTWGLMMAVGDTLKYEADNGQTIALRIAGTLANSIFQGNILIDRNHFREIWPAITGSEVFLLKTRETDREQVKTLLSQALHEYGVTVSTTNDRLKQFNTVTNTYLTIFFTLGGLGLLLGIMCFIIVVRKNLVMRRREIELYATLGFTKDRITDILYKENITVPLFAIITGVVSSLAGVSLSFMNTGVWIWLAALLFTLILIACMVVFVRRSVKGEVDKL